MKVAVVTRRQMPLSFRIYRDNVLGNLAALGVEACLFDEEEGRAPADCDLVWEPGLGMRAIPRVLRHCAVPVVGTVHGVRVFSMPRRDLARGLRARLDLYRTRRMLARSWDWFGRRAAAVIAVSEFGRSEVARAFRLRSDLLHVVHHGVDHATFRPDGEVASAPGPYFLVVAARGRAKKNVDRIFAAYARLPQAGRPGLVAVIPGYDGEAPGGVRVLRDALDPAALAAWYRGALAFVLPSLHETFCFPVVEAMACGCPVLTSTTTACAEVAADAALLVDPRSVAAITAGMRRLTDETALGAALRERGLVRAAQFTWRKSAERHLAVFEGAGAAARAAGSAPARGPGVKFT